MRLRCALLAVALATMASSAGATVIYDNGGPNTSNGYWIDPETGLSVADDFTLSSPATLTGVGFYYQDYYGITGWSGDVSYRIYSGDATPTTLLATGAGQNVVAVDSGLPWCCGGGNAYLVTFDLVSPLSVGAGTRYWLNLFGADTDMGTSWWVTADDNGTPLAQYTYDGATFGPLPDQLAFYLDSSSAPVPEPTTTGLLGLGLVTLVLRRRRHH
jgi:hypothetical protein